MPLKNVSNKNSLEKTDWKEFENNELIGNLKESRESEAQRSEDLEVTEATCKKSCLREKSLVPDYKS